MYQNMFVLLTNEIKVAMINLLRLIRKNERVEEKYHEKSSFISFCR